MDQPWTRWLYSRIYQSIGVNQ